MNLSCIIIISDNTDGAVKMIMSSKDVICNTYNFIYTAFKEYRELQIVSLNETISFRQFHSDVLSTQNKELQTISFIRTVLSTQNKELHTISFRQLKKI